LVSGWRKGVGIGFCGLYGMCLGEFLWSFRPGEGAMVGFMLEMDFTLGMKFLVKVDFIIQGLERLMKDLIVLDL